MDWTGETLSNGVREREFRLVCEGRTVPGVLWLPEHAHGTRPLVLLGHGGGLHKRAPYITGLARRLVRHHGIAAVAIDGPDHGARRPDGGLDFDKVWAERLQRRANPKPGLTDEMVADWKATLDAVQSQGGCGEGPVGYWGLSMGTIYGLPFVAAEPRVQVAVLGLMGIAPAPTTDPWLALTQERLGGDVGRVTCPVLFLTQSDDELVPRDHALCLFDALGTKDRRLHLNPGAHSAVPVEEIDHSEAFLARHLLPGTPGA